MDTTDRVYTVQEAAKILKVSIKTIRRMIDEGQVDATKIRGLWRIKAASVNKHL